MTTDHEYGYLYNPPDAKEGDEGLDNNGTWQLCLLYQNKNYCIHKQRRRLIQPGEGFEIVGLDENIEGHIEFTDDGITWRPFNLSKWNVRSLLSCERWKTCLAIRRPKQLKERVRYFQGENTGLIYRTSVNPFGQYFSDNKWIDGKYPPTLLDAGMPELTSKQAADIIGYPAVFGERKEGDEKCVGNIHLTECLDTIESQAAQLARQSEQIDALVKRANGLARFARHTYSCAIEEKELHGELTAGTSCTCGLNELLSAGDCTETAPPRKSPADS